MLRGTKGFLKKEILKLVRFLGEISPEIINLPNSMLISLAPAIKAEMKVPICCTMQGEDLFLESLRQPYRNESLQLIRENAVHVDAFIAVSHYGARSMAGYLGIDPKRTTATESDPFTIGYLARISPEKGLHFLCEAYRRLRSRNDLPPSRLWAAGYLAPEQKSYLAEIRQNLDSWGLSNQFHYHGELDRSSKMNFLKDMSVFSVPEIYNDPKGLFLLEAMACGIPVVQPRRGAFTEIVEATGGGLLVEPDNPDALAQAFLDLWKDPARRAALGANGYRGVRERYSAAHMAQAALEIYRSLV
jgi:glycosyltransferase involved in cell wall biosynthesis